MRASWRSPGEVRGPPPHLRPLQRFHTRPQFLRRSNLPQGPACDLQQVQMMERGCRSAPAQVKRTLASAERPLSCMPLVGPSPHGRQALQALDARNEAMRQLQPAHEALCKSASQILRSSTTEAPLGQDTEATFDYREHVPSDWNTPSSDFSSHSLKTQPKD